jgi:erythromycin esterase-like protein
MTPRLSGDRQSIDMLRERAQPFEATDARLARWFDRLGRSQAVLLGEASHGTHEFYAARIDITKRLIEQHGATAVAVEADWPDAYAINRYVRGAGSPGRALEALGGFERFPSWMWRNTDVLAFVEWLRGVNDRRAEDERVGFYGLDLYSLHASMRAVLRYLAKVDPAGADRARARYGCFDRYGGEPQEYGYAATLGLARSCEDEAVGQLVELRRRAADYATRDGRAARDDFFFAEQNARLVRNAEEYYRSMFRGRVESWNLRDRHMADTLAELLRHLGPARHRGPAVVWAHNSHLGDARATEMGAGGELNVGQLVREQFGADAVLVGFTTHAGTVTAASTWDGAAERKAVRPAMPGSYEHLFPEAGLLSSLVAPADDPALADALRVERLERAIGVIYRPETERQSHYFHARLPEQFDYVVHIDETTAVEPLEREARPAEAFEVDETYPSGL